MITEAYLCIQARNTSEIMTIQLSFFQRPLVPPIKTRSVHLQVMYVLAGTFVAVLSLFDGCNRVMCLFIIALQSFRVKYSLFKTTFVII